MASPQHHARDAGSRGFDHGEIADAAFVLAIVVVDHEHVARLHGVDCLEKHVDASEVRHRQRVPANSGFTIAGVTENEAPSARAAALRREDSARCFEVTGPDTAEDAVHIDAVDHDGREAVKILLIGKHLNE